ncbi:MAG: hypothetical protein ACI84E_002272, partial [Planctomycetota bacterium]
VEHRDFGAPGAYPYQVFTTPLGLTALLGVPLVVFLHLYQRRFKPHPVSALFLWGDLETHSPSGRTRQKLLRSPSFWLEILAALLLGLALGSPVACGSGQAEHLVVVLDSSASMAADPIVLATAESPGPIDEAARRLIRQRIADLPANSRVTLIQSGARPTLIAGPAVLPGEAKNALADWFPGHGRHDLGPAVALGRELAGEGAVVLVTDHFDELRWPAAVEVVALGTPSGNLAIVRATRSQGRDAQGAKNEFVSLTVANLSPEPRIASLEFAALSPDGSSETVFGRVPMQIAGGENRTHKLDLPPASPSIIVRLADDELNLDNVAFLAPLPPRTLSLYSPLDEELRLGLGLATGIEGTGPIDRLLELVPDAVAVADAERAHLVIGGAAIGAPTTWNLAIEAPGSERQNLIGPFLKDLRDPVLMGTTLEGIVWSHSTGYTPPGFPIISAGGAVLATREERGATRIYHLSMDPRRSTLQRSPDWPVFLSNLAEERRAHLPGPLRTTLRTAETLHFRATSPADYALTGPDGFRRELRGNRELTIEMPTAPGFYTLTRLAEALPLRPAAEEAGASDGPEEPTPAELARATDQVVATLGVNLSDAAESDLRTANLGSRESNTQNPGTRTPASWLEALLALGALACLLADGFVLGGHKLRPAPDFAEEPAL